MSFVIPTWLLWVGGGVLAVIGVWLLVWIALFVFLGASFYKAFKNWSWPG